MNFQSWMIDNILEIIFLVIFIYNMYKLQKGFKLYFSKKENRFTSDQLVQAPKTEKLAYVGTGPFTVRGNTLILPWKHNFSRSVLFLPSFGILFHSH